jgi:hypothetical protein
LRARQALQVIDLQKSPYFKIGIKPSAAQRQIDRGQDLDQFLSTAEL